MTYKNCIVDIKTFSLLDSTEWTTHLAIYRDKRDGLDVMGPYHLGNRSENEESAIEVGKAEAIRIIDQL
jgi:hypothetical protein